MPHPSIPKHARSIRTVSFPADGHPVERTSATALCKLLGLGSPEVSQAPGHGLRVGLSTGAWLLGPSTPPEGQLPWMWARIEPDGTGQIAASEPALLYAFVHLLSGGLTPGQEDALTTGLLLRPSFAWNRPLYDTVLTQVARDARRFNAEAYIERLARGGFTHLEVNGLAFHTAYEPGVPGEFYSPFYSYCPGLLQFVDSTLTRGLYDPTYQLANRKHLRELADMGRRFGLRPGMLCFEPRSMPERFFQRYPTLRGARVDHPFRSHMPRYTLAQDHPLVLDHYRQLMQNLMREVPDLAYLSVWSNDSGAGFEHTASLYVGRNGGPYMIREWHSHEKIAEAAGKSAVRWMRLLQEAAAEINPEFEVSLRIEPFKEEHDFIVEGLGRGVTVEAPSLLVRGYDLPYHHPKYHHQKGMAGTIFHTEMDPTEKQKLLFFRSKDVEPKLSYAPASSFNIEPLLGIPFPRMLFGKLRSMKEMDVRCVSAMGGLLNLELTPYWPNPEVIRGFQLNPSLTLEELLHRIATEWVGPDHAKSLIVAWDRVEEAVSFMPYLPLYSNFGFVWYRTWVRPMVPDIEAIPREERGYYERFMVSTANNPNINDLGKDVLFELLTEISAREMADAFDANVQGRIDAAEAYVEELLQEIQEPAMGVFADLLDRIRALRCWTITQRNTCAWVAGMYGYLNTEEADARKAYAAYLQQTIDLDLSNTHDLLNLWETSDTEFMLVSDVGETPFIYGDNLGDLLRKKITLTEQYRHYEPRIDPNIIWRIE